MNLIVLLFTKTLFMISLLHCFSSNSSMEVTSAAISTRLPSLTATTTYGGLYHLTKIIHNTMTTGSEIPIPSNNDDANSSYSKYTLQMNPSDDGVNQYRMNIKIGNSMGGKATITPKTNNNVNDIITIGGLFSTRMMPPPELYRIEVALSDILPNATSIRLEDNNSVLTIESTKGSVQAKRQM